MDEHPTTKTHVNPHTDELLLKSIALTLQELHDIKSTLSQLQKSSSQNPKNTVKQNEHDDTFRSQVLQQLLQVSHHLLQFQQSHEEMLNSLRTQTSELIHALQTSNTLLSDNLKKARDLQYQQDKTNSTLYSHVKMLSWKLAAILLLVSLLSALMGIAAERYFHTSQTSDVQRWEYGYRR